MGRWPSWAWHRRACCPILRGTGRPSQCSKTKKATSTSRPFSRVSHFTIYFQGRIYLHACKEQEELKAYWQGLGCLFLFSDRLVKSLQCSVFLEGSCRPDSKSAELSRTWGRDTGSLAAGRRKRSLGCAMAGDKCGNTGLSSDTDSSDGLYTGKSQKVLLLSPPKLPWGSPKPWAKCKPSKPPPPTELSHGLKPRRDCKCPWVDTTLNLSSAVLTSGPPACWCKVRQHPNKPFHMPLPT